MEQKNVENQSYSNIHNAYKQASLATNNVQHVVMLYNTIIKNVKQAQIAAQENKIEVRFNLLDHASDIIDGLQSALDHEKGEDISKILDDFYLGMYIRINQLQIEYDEAKYDQIIKEITLMRDAWVDVEQQARDSKLNESSSDNQQSDKSIQENSNNSNATLQTNQGGNSQNIQCDIDA